MLKGPLGLTEDDISHLRGLGYSRTRRRRRSSSSLAARTTPPSSCADPGRARCREIAAAGENMPPKSTYFFPKVPTGLLFNPLVDNPGYTMKATAHAARAGYRHIVKVRSHELTVDEPQDAGRQRHRPEPAGAARREPGLLHRGHDGDVRRTARAGTSAASRSTCEYTPAERGCPTRFQLVLRLPDGLTEEQVERLQVIAAKCPVHRTLEGEVMFNERVERVRRSRACAAAPRLRPVLLDPRQAAALDVHGRTTPPCSSRCSSTATPSSTSS